MATKRLDGQAIDFHRTEKYREERGFSVRVAGLANLKPPGWFKPPRLYKVENIVDHYGSRFNL